MRVLREENLPIVSIPSIIDTSLFSNEDLELFCDSTTFIGKSNQSRKSKLFNLNSSIQKMSEEIFEVSEVDEVEYLKIASSAYNDIDVNLKNLSADIEKIFESFNENVSICEIQKKEQDRKKKRGKEEQAEKLPQKCKQTVFEDINSIRMNCDDCLQMPKHRSLTNVALDPPKTCNELAKVPTKHPNSFAKDSEEHHMLPSVKAKIQYFDQLSKRISKGTQSSLSKPPDSVNDKARILPKSKPSKLVIKDHPAFSVMDAPKCIRIDTQDIAEEIHLKPDFVKDRIKQFESKTICSEARKTLPVTSVPETIQFNTKDMDLVTKMRCYFDKSSKHLPINPNFKESSECSPVPANNNFIRCPRKPTKKRVSTVKSSSNRTVEYFTSNDFLEMSKHPALQPGYDPFVESEKSLNKLGDIVHTIRSIREQGMTDVSRDLFKKFRLSLIAANEKLKDSKVLQKNLNDCPKKKIIAAVRPHIVSNGTFPRILEAIPKMKLNGMDTSVNVTNLKSKTVKDTVFLGRGLMSESELSYERFASALQRGESER